MGGLNILRFDPYLLGMEFFINFMAKKKQKIITKKKDKAVVKKIKVMTIEKIGAKIKKEVVTVGTKGWTADVPRPPKRATHAHAELLNEFKVNGSPKEVLLPISDFGCLYGVPCTFKYVRADNKLNLQEKFEGIWTWDGKKVLGIEKLRGVGEA